MAYISEISKKVTFGPRDSDIYPVEATLPWDARLGFYCVSNGRVGAEDLREGPMPLTKQEVVLYAIPV